MGWGVNRYPEGDDKAMSPEFKDSERKAQLASDWFVRNSRDALLDMLTDLKKKNGVQGATVELGAYIGLAIGLEQFIDGALQDAVDATGKASKLPDHLINAMKHLALAKVLKAMIEGKDEIEGM